MQKWAIGNQQKRFFENKAFLKHDRELPLATANDTSQPYIEPRDNQNNS